jgi:hypothetical protein
MTGFQFIRPLIEKQEIIDVGFCCLVVHSFVDFNPTSPPTPRGLRCARHSRVVTGPLNLDLSIDASFHSMLLA